jgi:hypothetical protein
VDFVAGLPDVDADRIAVGGASGGGTATIMLSILEPRIAAAFPAVMVSMNMQGGCVCENAPLYRVMTNNVELATLFAPKPEGMAAANDWTIDFLKRGLPEMKKIWGLFGAEAMVEGQHFEFPHNHNLHSREAQYNFLNKQLRLGWPEPVKEQPFEPVPSKELSVYDEQHPRPADEADATTLRKYMTRTSDEQLAAMTPDVYEKAVRVALEAMIVDHKPSADEREFVGEAPAIPADGGAWTGAIGRKGFGERVACKIIQPGNWNKAVVLWAHPDGCKSLSTDDPAAKKLLDSGAALIAIDWFEPAPKSSGPATKRGNPNPPYAAYANGYERTVIANRVHDLLTAFGTAQTLSKDGSVSVVAFGDAGPIALLACAVASHHLNRAAIDLNQFDFDRITADNDPMLLPGALKYGGIYGFVPLCKTGSILLCNARQSGRIDLAKATLHVAVDSNSRAPAAMVDWILSEKP